MFEKFAVEFMVATEVVVISPESSFEREMVYGALPLKGVMFIHPSATP